MSQAIIVLWIILLVAAVLAIPVIVVLLHRTLSAAKGIERYFAEMRDAGLGIAGSTEHIKALNDTISVASGMLEVAGGINEHASTIKETLAGRAQKLDGQNS